MNLYLNQDKRHLVPWADLSFPAKGTPAPHGHHGEAELHVS